MANQRPNKTQKTKPGWGGGGPGASSPRKKLRSSNCWKYIEIVNPTFTLHVILCHFRSFTIQSGGSFGSPGGGYPLSTCLFVSRVVRLVIILIPKQWKWTASKRDSFDNIRFQLPVYMLPDASHGRTKTMVFLLKRRVNSVRDSCFIKRTATTLTESFIDVSVQTTSSYKNISSGLVCLTSHSVGFIRIVVVISWWVYSTCPLYFLTRWRNNLIANTAYNGFTKNCCSITFLIILPATIHFVSISVRVWPASQQAGRHNREELWKQDKHHFVICQNVYLPKYY